MGGWNGRGGGGCGGAIEFCGGGTLLKGDLLSTDGGGKGKLGRGGYGGTCRGILLLLPLLLLLLRQSLGG